MEVERGTRTNPVWLDPTWRLEDVEGLDHAHDALSGLCVKNRWGPPTISCDYVPPPDLSDRAAVEEWLDG